MAPMGDLSRRFLFWFERYFTSKGLHKTVLWQDMGWDAPLPTRRSQS